ncbi:hypothetical protein ES703_55990 [subsurface metagenome]
MVVSTVFLMLTVSLLLDAAPIIPSLAITANPCTTNIETIMIAAAFLKKLYVGLLLSVSILFISLPPLWLLTNIYKSHI